jgi:hypothetical protein
LRVGAKKPIAPEWAPRLATSLGGFGKQSFEGGEADG